jgi:enterochelin esterase-like enzyme
LSEAKGMDINMNNPKDLNHAKYLKRTIVKETIQSQFLNEERSIRIYLPPGFNELISYPIIYAQDGQDIFMYGRIATIANYLILEEGMESVIIVGVDVSKKDRTSEYSTLGERNEDYKSFFVKELLPFVEERYQRKEEGLGRLLIGDSLGGTVSLDLALDFPDLFSNVLCFSGAFFQPTFERLHSQSALGWLNVWMVIGTGETEVETHLGKLDFLKWNRKIKALLEEKNVRLNYNEKEGKHLWGFWQQELPEGLSYFLKRNQL